MKKYFVILLVLFALEGCDKMWVTPIRYGYPPCDWYYQTNKMVITDPNLRTHHDYYGWCGNYLYVSPNQRMLNYSSSYPMYYEVSNRVRSRGYAVISFMNGWGYPWSIVIYNE